MIPQTPHPFRGIYTSTLAPFTERGQLDEDRLVQHFEQAIATPGIIGVLCNGHAGEGHLLTGQERRKVTEIAVATIGCRSIVVSGVWGESSEGAANDATRALEAGADAILVFPPFSWALSQDERMAIVHHETIAAATGAPAILYQSSVHSGTLAYRPAVLEQLVQIPNVVAIKEGSWEAAAYDANRRLVKRVAPDVDVMASGDEHLLPCFALGSEGSLVSLAVLMPAEIVALDRAVRASDLKAARALHSRIQPLANAIYGFPPPGHATARLKFCMILLRRWTKAIMRAPIGDLSEGEEARLRDALAEAGLLERVE